MKPLIIYHGNCADGFGAAWCFHHHNSQGYDFHAGVYQQDPPDVRGRDVVLVDFSYKRPVVESMLQSARSVTLIDHHKSAIDDLRPLLQSGAVGGITDIDRSGAMLAWHWLWGENSTPPRLIEHIQDRDLWRFALAGTREIQATVFSYPYDFAVWDQLMNHDLEDLRVQGQAIERKHLKDIQELLPLCTRKMLIGGHVVPVANMPYTMSSDAANMLAQDHAFAGCYYDGPVYRTFSLRSRSPDGMDVSLIAEQYGGGGHKHASGFRYDINRIQELEVQ